MMGNLFGTFERETIRLTFRLLPTLGETPWMIGGSPTSTPAVAPVTKYVSPPWFSQKAKTKSTLDDVVENLLGKFCLPGNDFAVVDLDVDPLA